MPTSPPTGRTRPLPRPPGANGTPSGSSYATPVSVPMPEPRPYTPVASPSQTEFTHNRTSSSSTAAGASRRLPTAPEGGVPAYISEPSSSRPSSSASSIPDAVRANGLPTQVRFNRPPPPPSTPSFTTTSSASSSRAPGSLHPYAVATPISDAPPPQLPSPNWSSPGSNDSRSPVANGYPGAGLIMSDSNRPKGALAPAVPGQSNAIMLKDYTPSPTSISSPDANGGFMYKSPESPKPYPTTDLRSNGYAGPADGINGSDPYLRSSMDDMQGKGASSPNVGSGSGSLLEPTCQCLILYSQAVADCSVLAANLGRSGSGRSGVSSFLSNYVDVGPSTSAMPPPTNGYQNAVAGPSKTYGNKHAGAGVTRGGSLSSFQSIGSGNSGLSRVDDQAFDIGLPGGSRIDRFNQRNNRERVLDDIKRHLALHEGYDSEEEFDEVEEEDRFVNLALLSHLAVRLRDKVPRGTHVKGGIPYSRAFTGRDVVVSVSIIAFSYDASLIHGRRLYKRKFNVNSLTCASLRPIAASPSRLRVVCKANCASSRQNGVIVSCKIMWKTCMCSSMTKKAAQIHATWR